MSAALAALAARRDAEVKAYCEKAVPRRTAARYVRRCVSDLYRPSNWALLYYGEETGR